MLYLTQTCYTINLLSLQLVLYENSLLFCYKVLGALKGLERHLLYMSNVKKNETLII